MDYINTLISGIIVFKVGRKYIYVNPASAKDLSLADFFSQEQYDAALIDGLWTQENAEIYLQSMGYWKKEDEEEIEKIGKNIENMKLDYYNHFYNTSNKEYIKRNIKKQEEKSNTLYNKKYLLYDKTCEYIKKYAKTSYILQNNAYFYDGGLASEVIPLQILYEKQNLIVSDISSKLRKLARSSEWRNRWIPLKHEVFENELSSLTDIQLSIVSWSSYYDGVYHSYDRPSDDIIEDDIALDGWAISEKRKRKEEEKKKNVENMLPKNMKNAGEIFIPARNTQEASDILSLNNAQAQAKIRSLKNDLKHSSSINDSELTDNVLQKQMHTIQSQKRK